MITVYVALEGFDLGTGALYFLLGRTPRERERISSAIGLVWSGNETWLVVAGGVLFLASPRAYAGSFSGLYFGLWLLIGRGLALELRHQPGVVPGPRDRGDDHAVMPSTVGSKLPHLGPPSMWLRSPHFARARALFRVVDAAYEKRSIAISSNIHPSGFDELMPKSLATATVERLLHHAHVLITDGQDSYRLAQATAGKGVRPLT